MSSETSDSIQRRLGETTFIEPNGGLFTEQLIQKLRNENCSEDAVQPKTFEHPGDPPSTTSELEVQISEAWDDLEERWDEVTRDNELFGMDVSEARRRWILKLFEALGFEPEYQQANLDAGELEANLSHLGWPRNGTVTASPDAPDATPPVLHTIRPDGAYPLDDGGHQGASGRQQSPHDELQRYLNATDDVQWSIVTDGLKLRVLRDYYHTYTRGYVEFDLENIFTNRNYDDFRALYRVCHASRFIPRGDDEEAESPLESLYQVALATGVKVGEDLQSNVVEALETLGNGFLNQEIRETLEEGGQEEAEAYYQDLLRIVYRLLFLLFAEQRGMMADRGDLYTKEYSISALRERAERKQSHDHQTDIWEGLKVTFRLVGQGVDEEDLHVPGYNGGLFDDEKLEFVTNATCPNEAILETIHNLTHVEQEGYQQRISYADLGVDEIGAVYESLLEYSPKISDAAFELDGRSIQRGQFYLDDSGIERKETGSYYTKPELVDELIQSALKPVVDNRVNEDATQEEQEEALLNIDVCDPACGSGAFLIAANNYLGKRLAEIRSDSAYPNETTIRQARRSVVQHCMYGVDLNPMAVELAKVSLWINSAVEDQPLSFLDHRIRCGNSLIGTNRSLVDGGLPDDAYETSGGRDWHPGNEIRRRVRKENKERDSGNSSLLNQWGAVKDKIVALAEELDELEEYTQEDINQKAEIHKRLRNSEELQRRELVFDAWTSAFFWPMDTDSTEYPTPATIEKLRRNPNPSEANLKELKETVEKLSRAYSFFHWDLEFPAVFNGAHPGFDCILTNPPWEKIKVEEKEWFSNKRPDIADAGKRKRTRLINELEETDPTLYKEWRQDKSNSERTARFIRESGRFDRSAVGDLNTYPVFAELTSTSVLSHNGRSGIIVKTGIATDRDNEDIFGYFVDEDLLIALHDFRNSENLFPDVHQNERFCLLTLGKGDTPEDITFSFLNTNLREFQGESGKMTLTSEQIELINPNTKTVPTFRSEREKEITLAIHSGFPVLINDDEGSNPWGITYYQMFHLTNDSNLFEDNTRNKLEEEGYVLEDNGIFTTKDGTDETPPQYLPLYEGKHIHQFDHRFNTFEEKGDSDPSTRKLTEGEKSDPNTEPLPRNWVSEEDFVSEVEDLNWTSDWVFAFRDVADATTNFRTSIGTLAPFYPFGNTASLIFFDDPDIQSALVFTSFFNSFVFDFALRQSIGGTHLNKYILKQLPMPSPETVDKLNVNYEDQTQNLHDFLVMRAKRLIWTSHSLDCLSDGSEIANGPYKWGEVDRDKLRAEVDAAIAKVYGLSREDFAHVINSFSILKNREEKELGTFETKVRCLDAFDQIKVVDSNK